MNLWPRGEIPDWLDVSRETCAALITFLDLVEKWQPTINLISRGTVATAWHRHILDSAQLFALCPDGATTWVDLGSGGGFPGIVVAILAKAQRPDLEVVLVEADKRKSAFLVQAVRTLELPARIMPDRAEALPPLVGDIVSARALTSLAELCGLAARHLAPTGTGIFPKGAQANAEVAMAQQSWNFDWRAVQSRTDPSGQIITMKNIRHA